MNDLLEGLPSVYEGYDVAAERGRYRAIPPVTVGSVSLNRGTARVEIGGAMEAPEHGRVREEHVAAIFTNALEATSPVLELGYPVAGSYVACRAGVYLDCELACAQKLVDERHPLLLQAVERLTRHGLLLRREINTDDFLTHGPGTRGEIHTPQEYAARLAGIASESFPIVDGGYRAFLSNSGTEAVEAGLKLAMLVRYRQLLERYGEAVFARLMADLGIPRSSALEAYDTSSDEPVYDEYPFFVLGFQGAFHGRTLGSVTLTCSRRAHQLGFSKGRWHRHLSFQRGAEELAPMLDPRPLTELLDAPGGVRAVIASGRLPRDLVAVFVAEVIQGEGGYRVAERGALRRLGQVLEHNGILYMIDEVQTFGRTGEVFAAAHHLNEPDIIALAKGAFVGATLARSSFERYLHGGWHANTWGGSKLFDNEIAYATLDALTDYRDPVLDGMGYVQNCRVKGAYLAALLERVRERCPEMLLEHGGLGLMHGVTVEHRSEVIAEAWRQGLKLLACGPAGERGRIRLLFLADCLTKELEDFAGVFLRVLEAVRARHEGA